MTPCIGFTGTQRGMTKEQKETFAALVKGFAGASFHHGDCIGADADAHELAFAAGMVITIHPPANFRKRAFKKADHILASLPYLERNKNIVTVTNNLVATPGEYLEQLRSGTWSTIRAARKLGRRIYIIQPNGTLKVE